MLLASCKCAPLADLSESVCEQLLHVCSASVLQVVLRRGELDLFPLKHLSDMNCSDISHAVIRQDQLLLKQTPEMFRGVLGAKVSGLLAMARHVGPTPLSAVLLFSSVSSIVAPLGQPNYAVANAMLNAWANAQSSQVPSSPPLLCPLPSQCQFPDFFPRAFW